MTRRLPFVITIAAIVVAGAISGRVSANEAPAPKVAIIVGPVGSELTPVYLELAELAASAAEERGAEVARAYSPDATAERVLEAVADASIVIYLGHGVGSPNPYSEVPNPASVNGWGLNGRNPDPEHGDSVAAGQLAYYGEAWITEHARPAPGWVMIYSNACYAPGAGEGFDEPADEATAAARVSAYSRAPLAELGASAYFATDFYAGAAHLVGALLDHPELTYGEIFASEPRHAADAVVALDHVSLDGVQVLLQRSSYFEGQTDYWYAFAGDPDRTVATAAGPGAVTATAAPLDASFGFVSGSASSYGFSAGHEGEATVALPVALGGRIPDGAPRDVLVCADRCVLLPAVDSCPCYVGTPNQRIANLSVEAWRQVTDLPLEEGLVEVEVYLDPIVVPRHAPGGPPRA